ncbi:hypothetical protein [Clostridium saccharoperbutylacetonicum]|uniref:hypothetical protein n=1 Tax=Clostridium saccharoperbutylacetonicum TaxID=36745 RepID=UPI000983ECAC|nr:hypothetical protein [Clostridium saccharoperbutylacetonicum]AQR95524.1 hypothetical protein CLSAP_28400 [Clostridium saccharoperbutylacetonicum]NSB31384.1 hypothetical protein [Clostridium saccharoperbutylacetonicum]
MKIGQARTRAPRHYKQITYAERDRSEKQLQKLLKEKTTKNPDQSVLSSIDKFPIKL